MSNHVVIFEVILRSGLVEDYTDLQGLEATIIKRNEMSKEVVDAILDNNLLTAGGVYGNPEYEGPVEVTSLEIVYDHGVTQIIVYNLGIMLFHTNDEIYPRVLRVQGTIEKQTEKRQQKAHKGRELASLPGPGKRVRLPEGQKDKHVYQIKVFLLDIEPRIWRRFLVPSNVTLHRLHLILQDVMGWANYHLYRFKISGQEYSEPDPDNEFYELNFKNSKRKKLGQVMTDKGDVFRYEYDFGDSWQHMLLVEDILEYQPGMKYPVCLTGERACPPEDCGGTHGYADLLKTIADPNHEDYQNMMTWLGGDFDPDRFDIDIVNMKLKPIRV